MGRLSEPTIGLLLGMAGGSFLYIAATDLIPETHEKGLTSAGSLFFGVLFLFLLSHLMGE
jgi:zinc transporter ZupT